MSEAGRHHHVRAATALLAVVAGSALLAAACGGNDGQRSTSTSDRAAARERERARAAARHRATVRGTATLDGAPFDADFLGVVVRDNGLATPCQAELPAVKGGNYEVQVYAATEGEGCGRLGTEMVLWVSVADQRVFSTTTVAWLGDGKTATFDAAFSTATPQGAEPGVTELAGGAYARSGAHFRAGTSVVAYVGETLCGVSTVRDFGDESVDFSMSIVGPDARPGCDRDQPVTFRVGGKPAAGTIPNDGAEHREVRLTV